MSLHSHQDALTSECLVSGKSGAGLPLRILKKPGFRQSAAYLSVNYGSVDSRFLPRGKSRPISVPAGIAHFLEHKMFEKERGDLFPEFAARGASANAMTSHIRTSYYFSCTNDFYENLDLLMELVFDGYFTQDLVDKEQGIIAQEIKGYDDSAGWRAFRATLECLFRKHPVREDIAGTTDSISKITADDLKLCHDAFYVPSNMVLACAGDLDEEKILAHVDRYLGIKRDPRVAAKRALPKEPMAVQSPDFELVMPVAMPMLFLGLKGPVEKLAPLKRFKLETAMSLALDVVFGESEALHEELYASGLIGDDFSWSVRSADCATYALIGGQTPEPQALADRLMVELKKLAAGEVSKSALERTGRRIQGDFVRLFDAPGSACGQLVSCHFEGLDLFELPGRIAALGARAIMTQVKEFLNLKRASRVVLMPNSGAN